MLEQPEQLKLELGEEMGKGAGGICCCFSDAPLDESERPAAYSQQAASGPNQGRDHPFGTIGFGRNKFQVPMKDTLCHGGGTTLCCIGTFVTCTYGTNW